MPEKTGQIPLRTKVKELERIYVKTQKEIGSVLLTIDPASFSEIKANSAQKKAGALIRQLNRSAIRWARESIPRAYTRGYAVSKTKLEVIGAKRDENFDLKIHKQTVEGYIEATIGDLVTSNESIMINVNAYIYLARKASQNLMQIQQFDVMDEGVIGEIIEDTIEQGQARGFASKRIHEYLRLKLLDGNFIDKAGRSWNLGGYSKMVARTRLRQVQTEAVKNTCAQYENDLVQWSRHSDSCPDCAEYEGQIYSLSGKSTTYSALPAEPPLHPNCEHDLSPTSEVAIQFREQYA